MLAHDLLWRFIFTKTKKRWLTQVPVTRPFRKTHFTNQSGLQPGAPAHFGAGQPATHADTRSFRQICKRTVIADERSKFLMK